MTNNQVLRSEYLHRINRVIDYIDNHLADPLTLDELASIANFSPYHFHRIFGALLGETLNQFILRLRLEKSASLLLQDPKESITSVALDCGFSSSATFARSFKDYFKMSASEWRSGRHDEYRKNCKTNHNIRQSLDKDRKEYDVSTRYINGNQRKQTWRIQMKQKSKLNADVEVKNLDPMTVAYVRHVGPYKQDSALFERLFEQLCTWAGPRDLMGLPNTKFLSVYHDNPEITEEAKLRLSVCITVPAETEVSGEIGKMEIPGGKYAVAHFEIGSDQFEDAWNAVYGGWLPESGYQPDDRPCFEDCVGDPKEHPEGKHLVDIHVPVKPL